RVDWALCRRRLARRRTTGGPGLCRHAVSVLRSDPWVALAVVARAASGGSLRTGNEPLDSRAGWIEGVQSRDPLFARRSVPILRSQTSRAKYSIEIQERRLQC